jgi:hypothetical protein
MNSSIRMRKGAVRALTVFLSAACSISWSAVPGTAADLAKLDRRIGKEPAYKSQPKYCLLAFGPHAETRVWLVLDGDTLYADRNGNGDLTEPDEKITAEKPNANDVGSYQFKVGDVQDGPRLHKEVMLYVSKLDHLADQNDAVKALLAKASGARGYYIGAAVDMPGWKGTGLGGRVQQRAFYVDVGGVLQFADRADDAPIIWFGGSWKVSLFGQQRLTVGRETDVVLGVGTPGIGPGSTAWIDYDGVVPENAYPTLEISYPPKRPGDPPIRARYELTRRC